MLRSLGKSIILWFDAEQHATPLNSTDHTVDWYRVIPFLIIHIACFSVIWVGASFTAVSIAAFLYILCMFEITGFYHRMCF